MADAKKRFILSTEAVNSHGFQIDWTESAKHLGRFLGHPVMLYMHGRLIGRWNDIQVENGQLSAVPEFITLSEEETEQNEIAARARNVKQVVEAGFLNAASIGFEILSYTERENEPDLLVVAVMEASIVDIGSDPDALAVHNYDPSKFPAKLNAAIAEGKRTGKLSLVGGVEPEIKAKPKHKPMKLSASAITALGVSDEPKDTEVSAAVLTLNAEKTRLSNRVAELEGQLKQQQAAELEAFRDQAIEEGKVSLQEWNDDWAELAAADFALCRKHVNKLSANPAKKTPAKITDRLSSGATQAQGDRSSWTFEDWRKKDTAGLLAIKKEDPERYKVIMEG